MKRIIAAIATVALLATGGYAVLRETSDAKVIRFGVERDYAPIIWHDGNEPHGVTMDFIRMIESKTDLKFKPTFVGSLPELFAALEAGKIDAITSIAETDERKKLVDFTVSYLTVHGYLYFRSPQLSTKVIGVGKGFAMEAYLRKAYPSSEIKTYQNDEQVLAALNSGEIHAAAMDELSFVVTNKTNSQLSKTKTEFSYKLAFGLRHGQADIISKINQAIGPKQ